MEPNENIKFIRTQRAKMTQQEFADLLGVKKPHIFDIERGKVKLSYDLALKIAEHFSVSYIWLLYNTGHMLDCVASAEDALNKSNKTKRIVDEVSKILFSLSEPRQENCLQYCKEQKTLEEIAFKNKK